MAGRREGGKNKDDKKRREAWTKTARDDPKRATVSQIATIISEFSYTCTPTRSSFLGAAPRRIEEQRALRYFWDGERKRMMAMPDLGGRDPLGSAIPTTKQAPTRFQECVIFHFLLTGNRPESQEGQDGHHSAAAPR